MIQIVQAVPDTIADHRSFDLCLRLMRITQTLIFERRRAHRERQEKVKNLKPNKRIFGYRGSHVHDRRVIRQHLMGYPDHKIR